MWLEQLIKNGDITKGDVDDRSIEEIKPQDVAGYDRCHFFAGVGTWDYALNRAGWGDRPVWTASLPCQPFSSAGKRKGGKDERHLLPVYLELVKKCRPNTQIGEQVASSEIVGTELEASFVIAVQNGDYAKANKLAKRLVAQKGFTFTSRWVDDLHAEMEKAGYAVGYDVLGAHSVGAAHIRQRLYWVANNCCERHKEQQSIKGVSQQTHEHDDRKNTSRGSLLANPENCRGKGGLSEIPGSHEEQQTRQESRQNETKQPIYGGADIEWLYCRDNKYRPIKSGIKPLVDGVAGKLVQGGDTSAPIEVNNTQEARRMRLKGYGNAIQAQTATAFIRAVVLAQQEQTYG